MRLRQRPSSDRRSRTQAGVGSEWPSPRRFEGRGSPTATRADLLAHQSRAARSLCCSHPHEALHVPHPLPVLARRDRCRLFDAARGWGAVMSGFILRWSHIADMALRPLGLWLVFTIHMDDSTGRVSVRGLRVEHRGIF